MAAATSSSSNGGWEVHVSRSTGKPYYFNVNTGQSFYEQPPGCSLPLQRPAAPPTLPPPPTARAAALPASASISSSTSAASSSSAPARGGILGSLLAQARRPADAVVVPTASMASATSASSSAGAVPVSLVLLEKERKDREMQQTRKLVDTMTANARRICMAIQEGRPIDGDDGDEDDGGKEEAPPPTSYHRFEPCDKLLRFVMCVETSSHCLWTRSMLMRSSSSSYGLGQLRCR